MKAQAYKSVKVWAVKGKPYRGEVTVFLSLLFFLLVTLICSVMESASLQMAKNYRRADMNRAIESVFAEYQRDMLEEFDLFTMDAGYESGEYTEQKVAERLAYYGADHMEQEIQRVQFLTDEEGLPFRQQAAAYVEHRYGVDFLRKFVDLPQILKEQENTANEYEQKGMAASQELEDQLKENGSALPEGSNPIAVMEQIKSSPLVNLVMAKEHPVSGKQIDISSLASHRGKNQGYGEFSDVSQERTDTRLLFGEYLLEHFTSAVPEEENSEQEERKLDYELEYILEGKNSDRENLEHILRKLLLVRYVPNLGYIMTDSVMKAEAETLALTLCTLALSLEAVEPVTQVILFAWAAGESVADLRSLMAGKRVPLIKSKETWQTKLSGVLKLGSSVSSGVTEDSKTGLSYRDYLRILLFLEKKETAAMRGLDMIEKRMRMDQGKEWFRADLCINQIEFKSVCELRRGIRYDFRTYYGYR